MKNKFLLIPFLILIIPFLSGASVSSYDISTDMIGPFRTSDSNKTVSYSVISRIINPANVYEVFTFSNQNRSEPVVIRKPLHALSFGRPSTDSVDIPTSLLIDSGMDIKIELFNSNDVVLIQRTSRLFPIENKSKTLSSNNTEYHSQIVMMKLDSGSNLETYTEDYAVGNNLDYFETSIYYRIPIEQFYIEVPDIPNYVLKYGGADLIVKGNKKYFPRLRYLMNEALVPLEVYYDDFDDVFRFKFKQLYVDKKTLIMSLQPDTGFVATNNFYLPINKKEELSDLTFSISVFSFGINKMHLSWETRLFADHNYIGECQNSEYCVKGDVKR